MRTSLVSTALVLLALGCGGDDAGAKSEGSSPSAGDDDARKSDAGAGRDGGSARDGSSKKSGAPIENLGAACTRDEDCEGSEAHCIRSHSLGGSNDLSFPEGFCTALCSADADCGKGGACPFSSVASLFGTPDLSICMRACDVDAKDGCEKGYGCEESPVGDDPQTICLPSE